jgi:TolB-like protein
MIKPSLLQRLKERKLVQWGLAYLAGAWVLAEAADVVGGRWNLPDTLFQGLFILLGVGFFATLILAWYHGEKGRQEVGGIELLMLAALLVVAGVALSSLEGGPGVEQSESLVGEEVEDIAALLNERPGIAVLPFANRSELPSDQYFADGIQSGLLTRLRPISGLRVISRTSSDAYRDTNLTAPEIGRELNVAYVLEGEVYRAADQVRIYVQLIDAETDAHLWAEE